MPPRVSAHLPGITGTVHDRERRCDEVLAKKPAATGDHLWLKVMKDGLGTQQARAAIARSAAVAIDLVSCAGNRDRHGVCVQWFSVPADAVEHQGPLRRAGTQGKMRVLEVTSSHKPVVAATVERLRWSVGISGGAADDGYRRARAILDHLRVHGVPNYALGSHGGDANEMARWGRKVLGGGRLPGHARGAGISDGSCLAAFQDQLFNRWLAARIDDRLLSTCLPGEVVRSASGGETIVEDAQRWQKRFDSWEAVALGPLFGEGMTAAALDAEAREQALLAAAGLEERDVERLFGGRRAARVQPRQVIVDIAGKDLRITCELPVEVHLDALIGELLQPDGMEGSSLNAQASDRNPDPSSGAGDG